MQRYVRSALALLSLSLLSCGRAAAPADPQLVAQWLRTTLSFARAERLGPPVATRISAYGALALYEGYASDKRSTLRSLAGQLNRLDALPAPADGGVDGATVAAEAERLVLDSLFRDGMASTRQRVDSLAKAQVAARQAAGVGDAMRDRSVAHGKALASAILAWAATDSFYATRGRPWTAPTKHEQWENTATVDQYVPQALSGETDVVVKNNPNVALDVERATERGVFTNRPKAAGATNLPAFNPIKPTEPYWGNLRPFTLKDGDDCAPKPPLEYSEKPGSPFWQMGKQFYDTVKALTPEQKNIALFWADNPVATGTPGFHWISVVNLMIGRRNLTAEQAVEVYTLTSLAIADAFIGCWKEKYRSLVVRPVAYVQRMFDPKFTTLFATPPFPEYPSGHSTLSGAAAYVLAKTLGDTIPFVDSTQVDLGQPPRAFKSFTAARDEVAISRVYGGIHYVRAVMLGLTQGECIGKRVLERLKTRKAP